MNALHPATLMDMNTVLSAGVRPQSPVEEGYKERLTCAAQPASEVQERQVIEHTPTVEQQDNPHLDHQAGTESHLPACPPS